MEALRQEEPWRVQGREKKTSGVSDTIKSKPPVLLRHVEPLSWPYFRLLCQSAQLQAPRPLSAPRKATASPATAFSFILNCNQNLPLVVRGEWYYPLTLAVRSGSPALRL